MSLDVGWGPGGQSGGENPFDFVLPDKDETTTSWRWATVVSSSPLRVTLDGDDSPLLAAPWDMGSPAPRIPGDRVYCQINARRVVILGPNGGGGGGKATYIGAAIGTIQIWSGPLADIPQGWLLCDGRAVSRTTYASLHSIIASAYGSGDGSTTFNIPDLRGRVPAGQGGTAFAELGAKGGEETVTLTTAQMPSHTHTQASHTHTQEMAVYISGAWATRRVGQDDGTNAGSYKLNSETLPVRSSSKALDTGPATPAINATGSGQAHNNLQPFLTVRYIIKAQMLASEVQGLDATVRNLEVTGTTTGVHRAPLLGANVNLNDLIEPGAYIQTLSANASTALNYPTNAAGLCEVYGSGTPTQMRWQRYSLYGTVTGSTSVRQVYQRAFYNGAWSGWSVLYAPPDTTAPNISLASGATEVQAVGSIRENGLCTVRMVFTLKTAKTAGSTNIVELGTLPAGFIPQLDSAAWINEAGYMGNISTTGVVRLGFTPFALSAGQLLYLKAAPYVYR